MNNRLFEQLYTKHYAQVYNVAFLMTKSKETAEDMTAEAFLSAYQNFGQLQDAEKFGQWVGRIVANKCKDWFKKQKPTLFSSTVESGNEERDLPEWQVPDPDAASEPEQHAVTADTMRTVERMLESLPEEQRLCLLLFCMKDMKVADIATALGIPENTVKTRIRAARKKLQEQKDEYEKDGVPLFGVAFLPWLQRQLQWVSDESKVQNSLARLEKRLNSAENAAPTAVTGSSAGHRLIAFLSTGKRWIIVAAGAVAVAAAVLITGLTLHRGATPVGGNGVNYSGGVVSLPLSSESAPSGEEPAGSENPSENTATSKDAEASNSQNATPATPAAGKLTDLTGKADVPTGAPKIAITLQNPYATQSVANMEEGAQPLVFTKDDAGFEIDGMDVNSEAELLAFENAHKGENFGYALKGLSQRNTVVAVLKALNWISNKNASVQVHISANGFAVSTIRYTLNGKTYATSSNTFTVDKLPNGTYDFRVEVTDKNGDGYYVTQKIRKDDQRPTAKIKTGYTNGTVSLSDVSVSIEQSGQPSSTVQLFYRVQPLSLGYYDAGSIQYIGTGYVETTACSSGQSIFVTENANVIVTCLSEAGLYGEEVTQQILVDKDDPYINIGTNSSILLTGNLGDPNSKLTEAYYTVNGARTDISVDATTNRGTFSIAFAAGDTVTVVAKDSAGHEKVYTK